MPCASSSSGCWASSVPRYLIHPLLPQGMQFRPDTNIVAATVECHAGDGTIDVLLPGVGKPLKSLFEEPQQDDAGRPLVPWSPQALEFLLKTALPRTGWVAVAVP